MDEIKRFSEERERLNSIIQDCDNLVIKRFLNLDHNVYQEGALPQKTKELLGLVASIVLRCDDCINYHLLQCKDNGVTDAEFEEAVSVALIVGGSITIPHIRRMLDMWEKAGGKA